jgi:heme/copper-type cytochrome/quinol oxidase subunit 2
VPFRHVFSGIFLLEFIIATVVFGLVLAAMAAAVIVSRRKRRRGAPAARREHLHVLEAAFGLALAGMTAWCTRSGCRTWITRWTPSPSA